MAPRERYQQLPDKAPKPVMWKSLGWVHPQLEAFYHLETFQGDLDIDREAELRAEMTGMLLPLANAGVDVANVVFVRYALADFPQVLARFMGGTYCVGTKN